MNKKGKISAGIVTRMVAAFIIALSLPFMIANPNYISLTIFGFGNFLMVIGGNLQ